MSTTHTTYESDGPIATLTFNRPEARNAMTWDMYQALVDACDRVDSDAAIRDHSSPSESVATGRPARRLNSHRQPEEAPGVVGVDLLLRRRIDRHRFHRRQGLSVKALTEFVAH